MELLQQEQRRGGAGGLCGTAHQRAAAELAYQRRAEQALAEENCFKIYVVSMFFTDLLFTFSVFVFELLLNRTTSVHCVAVQT